MNLHPHQESTAIVAGVIAEQGYIVLPRFISRDEVDALRARLREQDAAGNLRAAAVGGTRTALPEVRGDRTLWLDPATAGEAERRVLAALEALRVAVNGATFAGLFALECHYAIYPPGARYQRHLDCLRDDDARVLTFVLYLNQDWGVRDGGELMLYVGAGALMVSPAGGTLVAFLSAQFEHEVLPAARERCSLTGWFRRREGAPC
jgi:SM-20-related protein